jgi:hypothetical protein
MLGTPDPAELFVCGTRKFRVQNRIFSKKDRYVQHVKRDCNEGFHFQTASSSKFNPSPSASSSKRSGDAIGRVPTPQLVRTAAARHSKSKRFFGRPLEVGTEASPLQRQHISNSTFTFVFTTV